ncbi:MAG: tRNA (adenosine(37)-N6)-threonylcarbamoyltransferase complex dimerization subunit type 1 TsaB [Gammaproteobacteria bacterium]
MTVLLGIETGSEACSVALWRDGEVIDRFEHAPRRHAAIILPMMESILAEAGVAKTGLDALVLGRGPGSFTGLRIASSVVQGVAYALDRQVVCISSLAALAAEVMDRRGAQRVITALDARMNEVYWGAFRSGEDGLPEPMLDECVIAPEQAPAPDAPDGSGPWFLAGPGFAAYADALLPRFDHGEGGLDAQMLPRACHLMALAARDFTLGRGVPADQARPVYLRDQVAWKKAV